MASALEHLGGGVYRLIKYDDHVPEAPNECCRTAGNVLVAPGHPDARTDLMIRVCVVCARRHVVLTADPGRFQMTGMPVG